MNAISHYQWQLQDSQRLAHGGSYRFVLQGFGIHLFRVGIWLFPSTQEADQVRIKKFNDRATMAIITAIFEININIVTSIKTKERKNERFTSNNIEIFKMVKPVLLVLPSTH